MGIFAGCVNQNAYQNNYQSNFNSFGNYGQNFGQYGQSPYQNSYQNSYYNSIFAMLFMAILEKSPETLQGLFQPQTEPEIKPLATQTIAPQTQQTTQNPQTLQTQGYQTSQTWQNLQTIAPITTQIYSQSMTSQQSSFTNNTTVSSNLVNNWQNLLANFSSFTKQTTQKPEDNEVVLIGSYKNNYINYQDGPTNVVNVDLGNTIKDFASIEGGNGVGTAGDWSSAVHNRDTSNDATLEELYSKMSDEDKLRNFNNGEVYVISKETGKVLGTVSNNQIVDAEACKIGTDSSVTNNNFKVTGNLGINTTEHWGTATNIEEGNGGQIELNGKKYNVDSTIIRKETPLILDLAGNGIDLTSQKDSVNFDLNGDDNIDKTAWTKAGSDDAFLVLDKDGNGPIDSGKELFGAQNGAGNGFLELAKYDTNKNGTVDANDEAYSKLQTWTDANHNGRVDDGELKSLLESNIKSISTGFNKEYDETGKIKEDQHGNTIGLVGDFQRADGSKGSMIDALLQYT